MTSNTSKADYHESNDGDVRRDSLEAFMWGN